MYNVIDEMITKSDNEIITQQQIELVCMKEFGVSNHTPKKYIKQLISCGIISVNGEGIIKKIVIVKNE